MHDSVQDQPANVEQQARAALDAMIAEHQLPRACWVHLYGLLPGQEASWLSVHLASMPDAHTWATALGTTPEPAAYLDSDSRLRCRVHVARMMTLPDCPVPVDVAYVLDVDAIQAVAL